MALTTCLLPDGQSDPLQELPVVFQGNAIGARHAGVAA